MTAVADPVIVTEAAADKITQLLDEEKKKDGGLRVFVQGGGCSGFQYGLMIEDGVGDAEVDKIFQSNGVTIFVDPIARGDLGVDAAQRHASPTGIADRPACQL